MNHLASSATSKALKDHRRQLKLMIEEIFLGLSKTTSQHIEKNIVEEVGVPLSRSAIKRQLHEWKQRIYSKVETTGYTQQQGHQIRT